ncbi:MAG: class IV adenylate cyclase [Pyrinomonadaceae bacterium]|nr:class IV adenylate cyclase [Pyrinomonadaceae bacterium]
MGIEIEKKYRLNGEEKECVRARLREIGAELRGADFEENTLYAGGNLDQTCVLRLRRTERQATLTFKKRFPSDAEIKHQREDETGVEDADALHEILLALGYRPALIYEKRRETWRVGKAEVVVDELPFGAFVEIEGDEESILQAEKELNLTSAEAEHATYPQLTEHYGARRGTVMEARFAPQADAEKGSAG